MRIAHPYRSLISAATNYFFLRYSPPLPPVSNLSKALILSQSISSVRRRTSTASMDSVDVPIQSEEDEKYGFRRKEMYENSLAGTMEAYGRHVFLCHKGPEAWVPRVEGPESDPLPKLLAAAFRARKDDIAVKVGAELRVFDLEKIPRLLLILDFLVCCYY